MSSKHLKYDDRRQIEKYLEENKSYTQIAKIINKHRSTVYYEIKHKSCDGSYDAEYAQTITEVRRQTVNSSRAKFACQDFRI